MRREVEINGIKFDIEMATAKRIDTFEVGDNVKVLTKEYSKAVIKEGVITHFYNFQDLPTIEVAVFDIDYCSSKISFIHINKDSEDFAILPSSPYESKINKNYVVESINNEIEKEKAKLNDLKAKKEMFLEYYGKQFEGGSLDE